MYNSQSNTVFVNRPDLTEGWCYKVTASSFAGFPWYSAEVVHLDTNGKIDGEAIQGFEVLGGTVEGTIKALDDFRHKQCLSQPEQLY